MKLSYILGIAGLSLATSAAFAQLPTAWVHDTVTTGSGYGTNVFYGLENGVAGEAAANNWHIGLSTSPYSASVIANHADNDVKVYVIAGATGSDFGSDLTTQASAAEIDTLAMYNSIETWEVGAFNVHAQPPFGYGWGDYDQASHWIKGDKIYLVTTSNGSYQLYLEEKQTYQVTNAPIWKFHVANIDGSNQVSKEIIVGGNYNTKNFVYYNFETDQVVDREPNREEWDILFTRYTEDLGVMMYGVFGVLTSSSERMGVAKVTSENIDTVTWHNQSLDSNINVIGRGWKSAGATVVIFDTITYFLSLPNQDVWQLEFTYGTTGSNNGVNAFRKRKVAEGKTGIVTDLNNNINNIVLFPNPVTSRDNATLLVDVNEADKAQIRITDITGKTIASFNQQISTGFQQIQIPNNNLSVGMYIVHIQGKQWSSVQKMIVQ